MTIETGSNKYFSYYKLQADRFGLSYTPRIVNGDHDNATDWVVGYNGPFPTRHFSVIEEQTFKAEFLSIRDQCESILEIGVSAYENNPEMGKSSTSILLENKKPSTKYVGIDLDNKTHLSSKYENVYTIQNDSTRVLDNTVRISDLGIETFDFIFIDGYHSVDVVLEDWKYTSMLTIGGIVAFHDCNFHPGPVALYDAIDPAHFTKHKIETPELIWGLAFAKRIK